MGSVGIRTGDHCAGRGYTQADHTGGRVVWLAMCLWRAGRHSGRAMLEPWTGGLSVAKILFLKVKVTSAWPGAREGCWGERQEGGRALPFDTDQWKSWQGELSPFCGCQVPPPPTASPGLSGDGSVCELGACGPTGLQGLAFLFSGRATSSPSLVEGVKCVQGTEISVAPGKHSIREEFPGRFSILRQCPNPEGPEPRIDARGHPQTASQTDRLCRSGPVRVPTRELSIPGT